MPLKDLVSSVEKITEDAIESLVAKYVRYDAHAKLVVFTPPFAHLSNEAKILTYLVALEGWPFVLSTPVTTSTRPSDLERVLRIVGGTLRPILKKLKEAHYVIADQRQYKIQLANLDASRKLIINDASTESSPTSQNSKKTHVSKRVLKSRSSNKASGEKSATKDLSGQFNKFLDDGFFDQPRNIGEVVDHFSEIGTITKSSSISGILLTAVRDKRLKRKKAENHGRPIWIYSRSTT